MISKGNMFMKIAVRIIFLINISVIFTAIYEISRNWNWWYPWNIDIWIWDSPTVSRNKLERKRQVFRMGRHCQGNLKGLSRGMVRQGCFYASSIDLQRFYDRCYNFQKLVTIQRSWKLYYKLWNKIRQFAVKQKIQCMAWLDFHWAGYKPSPLGGIVFSR